MRRRFGAMHSDSTEDYIQKAIDCQDKPLCYYNNPKCKAAQRTKNDDSLFQNFDFCECDGNTTIDDFETENKLTKQVMVLDNQNVLSEVQDFCSLPKTSSEYSLEFCHKCGQQTTFHFWVNNIKNAKFEQLIDVYIRNCDHFVYFYIEEFDQEFQEFAERLASMKKDYTLYKVSQNSVRSKSCDNLQCCQHTTQITSKNVTEALQTITNRII